MEDIRSFNCKEYGYLFGIETSGNNEYYDDNDEYDVVRLNSARSGMVLAAVDSNARVVYLPYYTCNSVFEALKFNGIKTKGYEIDENFNPILKSVEDESVVVIVNYFGNATLESLKKSIIRFRKVIIDNSQGFFTSPILQDGVYNVYSPRKFFGVSDGGYIVYKGKKMDMSEMEYDSSWQRARYLLRDIEEGSNNSYDMFLGSENDIGYSVKQMSLLTRKLLKGIDYEAAHIQRLENLSVLRKEIGKYNILEEKINNYPLMCYPFYYELDNLREYLVSKRIFVPQWWKWILDKVSERTIEARLSKWLLPIPIDHRLSKGDMLYISRIIKEGIKK